MSPEHKIEPGELFYRFYKKRISSFLVTVYKAGITGKDKDIHKLRVDLKKVNALFNFFEILELSGFIIMKNAKHFREIFRQAGKIREIQVNLQYIEKYDGKQPGFALFRRFLQKEQKKSTKEFISAITLFDEKKLKTGDKAIKKFCKEMDSGAIMTRSGDFLCKKAGLIDRLAVHPEKEDNIHKIRQELKKMAAIASLLIQVGAGQEIKLLMAKLNHTEVLIGEWHDRVVLMRSTDQFIKSGLATDAGSVLEIEKLKESIKEDNARSLEAFIPMVKELTSIVMQGSLKDPVKN